MVAVPSAPPTDTPRTLETYFDAVYVAIDGSPLSTRAVALAATVAARGGKKLTAAHAFAARLHDNRFRQMEGGLPPQFQDEVELQRQRRVHDKLITRGLRLISESYLDRVVPLLEGTGVALDRRSVEGRNWRVLLEDIRATEPDLVVIGARGLGAVDGIVVGGVCERVVRRLEVDALVVRDEERPPFERVAVALDGSPESLGALHAAIALVEAHGGSLELLSSFDPEFHYAAFRAISGVLSHEAAKVFRFEEQQRLHEEIIDEGLERIYRGHLDVGARIVAEAGLGDAPTTLLSGKAPVCLRRYIDEHEPSTLFLGRTGVHSSGDLDLGLCPETLLRSGQRCHLYLAATRVDPKRYDRLEAPLTWTTEATERLSRVPGFVRPMVAGAVTRRARDLGHTVITSDLLDEVRRAAHHGAAPPAGHGGATWTESAERRLDQVPEGVIRDLTRQRVEALAAGAETIGEVEVQARYASWAADSAHFERALAWQDDALARLERIPDTVRGAVAHEVEKRARASGLDRVDGALLDAFREELEGGSFHS